MIFTQRSRGVSNGKFQVLIQARECIEADWSLPLGVSATLLDALDPTTQGYFNSPRLPLPKEGQPGTFRGLLEWRRRDEEIIAPTVYHDGALMRQMSVREKGNALNIPVDRAEEMTESNLELLT